MGEHDSVVSNVCPHIDHAHKVGSEVALTAVITLGHSWSLVMAV